MVGIRTPPPPPLREKSYAKTSEQLYMSSPNSCKEGT